VTNLPDDEVARLEAERARLAAEVNDLRSRIDQGSPARPSRHRVRGVTAAVLVVLTAVVATVAVTGVWARRNALNTDRWVRTVTPIGEDADVQQALGRWLTTELMMTVDPEQFFEDVLPERGQILAGPLTSALRGYVNDQVDTFLASDTFEELWVAINRRVHTRVVDVLEGDTPENVEVVDGKVQVDFIPVINALLARIGERSPELFGRTIDIPTVTVDEVPESAIARLESALGRDLPPNFGQFEVFDATQLQQAQDAVRLFNRAVVALVVLAVLLIALTLWVAPRRRRTLLQLMVGVALGVVLVRRLGLRLEEDVVDMVRPENQAAVKAVVGAFVSSLFTATSWVLGIVVAVIVVAIVTGPYLWVVSLRRRTVALARAAGGAAAGAAGRTQDPATIDWVVANKEALQIGTAVVGLLVLLWFDLSWWGILFVLALVGAIELVVWRVADQSGPGGDRPGDAAPTPAVGESG
jgi:hypothetical protein